MEVFLILSKIKKHPLILGTILLTGSGLISRILGFFYRIFLSQAIGSSGLGLYQLIFPVFTLCLAISASGIQTAISRFVASKTDGHRFLWCGILLSVCLSGLLSVFTYYLSPWIAADILKEPRTQDLLRILSFALIPAVIHACFNGYYYGKKNSTPPALCQIIEQLARVLGTFVIYQVLLEQGRPLEPIHAVYGIVISELAGLLVSVTSYLVLNEPRNFSFQLREPFKMLGLMAIPLTLNHVLMTLSHSLEHLLLPQQLMAFGYNSVEALSHFGILTGMALSVIFFPSAITNSLSVLLLPRVSETKSRGDLCAVLDTIKGALCCGVVLGSLCTFVFLFSADWFGTYLFHNPLAGFYIRILSILCPFMYTSSLLSSIVNGLGYASLTLACNISGCIIRILSIWFLVPKYGMYAYILAMIVSAVVVTVELVIVVKRKCGW
ncbi:MAG: polysaccharide biosynthesis protein [Agathobacter sp.]|nr:polysaccharide biosynthesis protein [Agathobacter sp.]